MPIPISPTENRTAQWPQFHLRTLMLAVTGCCVLFGLMRQIGPLPSVGLCFFLLLVVLHIAGNAIGTSLRNEASRAAEAEERISLPVAQAHLVANSPSRLREYTPLGRPVFLLTAFGAVLGGALSSLAYAYWTNVNTGGLIVGSISAAVVGGFFGFLASSFLKIIYRAWRQALDEIPRV